MWTMMLQLAQNGVDPNGDPNTPVTDPETTGTMSERAIHLIENYGVPAVTVLIIILVALIVAAWASRTIRAACGKAKIDETLSKFFGTVARWAVLLLAILFCLDKFGINVTSFAVVLGAAGLAIGLAFQGSLSNLASGIMLLTFRPFKVGDAVKVAGELGKIDEVELFTTSMDTFDNRRIILPNSTIFGSVIENISHHPIRRVDVSVGVEYSADLDRTREVLEATANGLEGRLDDPEPQVLLLDLGDSSVNWVVRVWTNSADFWAIRDALTRAVKVSLDEAGLGIPFPQVDVHMKTDA